MKKSWLVIGFLLLTNFVFGQSTRIVFDTISDQGIAYINIWVVDKEIGTTYWRLNWL